MTIWRKINEQLIGVHNKPGNNPEKGQPGTYFKISIGSLEKAINGEAGKKVKGKDDIKVLTLFQNKEKAGSSL